MFANLNENRYLRPPHALWLVLLGLLPIVPQRASGQCTFQWQRGFGGAGADNSVMVMRVLDLGNGPVVVAGGLFNRIGDAVGSSLATWDGTEWRPLITGLGGQIYSLAIFDDGTGPALYVGGNSLYVNGTLVGGLARIRSGRAEAVPGLSVGPGVWALESFDDGAGPALYIAGTYSVVNSVLTRFICRWNGAALDRFNGGVVGGVPNFNFVAALCTFDAGDGPRLYAGGRFHNIGGESINDLGYWDGGAAWRPVSWAGGVVQSLRVADLGDGEALYIGGSLPTVGAAPCRNVARLRGAGVECVGDGATGPLTVVHSLTSVEEASGTVLLAGGNGVQRWNGITWSPLSPTEDCGGGYSGVQTSAHYDYLGRRYMLFGGGFKPSGLFGCGIWQWTGEAWDQPPPVHGFWAAADLRAATIGRIGGEDLLIVGGNFSTVGGLSANNVAAWNGRQWRALGAGLPPAVSALAIHDDGSGPALFAATAPVSGATSQGAYAVYRWNGAQWTQAGDTFWGGVLSLAEVRLNGTPTLFAGGDFRELDADKVVPRQYLAQWDGAHWQAMQRSPNSTVRHITAWRRSDGERLLIGGTFTQLGQVPTAKVGAWDGATWQGFFAAPTDFTGAVQAVAGFSANGPDEVYACGELRASNEFTSLARFDGTRWVAVPGAPPNSSDPMRTMLVANLGAGPRLVLGHYASASQAVTSWDGTTWTTLAGNVRPAGSSYLQLASGNVGTTGTSLALVGNFDTVGPVLTNSVAIYADTPPEPTATPASHRVNVDQTTSLFVRVPDPAATFQWFKDGQPLADGPRITGTQTPTLTIRDIQPGDDGWYEVEYRVACGATRPRAARLTVNPGGPCPADANGDRRINQLDLDTVLFNFGATVPPGLDGDLNGDGQVDQTDLDAVLSDYGAECA